MIQSFNFRPLFVHSSIFRPLFVYKQMNRATRCLRKLPMIIFLTHPYNSVGTAAVSHIPVETLNSVSARLRSITLRHCSDRAILNKPSSITSTQKRLYIVLHKLSDKKLCKIVQSN